jgi:NAD(P)-dependent dehydrogenase (short-subunit alcohol dehydrogenase family)
VSNAGIFNTKPFDELSLEQWRRMLNVHLDGTFFLCQPAFRVMKRRGYGRFVMVASSAALFGLPSESHYAAAKGGIFGLSNVMALEGAPHGILSNCCCRPAIHGWPRIRLAPKFRVIQNT